MIKRISSKLRFRLLRTVILAFFLVGTLTLSFTVPGYAAAAVVRTLPSTVIPGQTFDVTITFSAPANDFNAIGLTDFAPTGWGVAVNNTWNNPDSNLSNVSANKIEYIWYGPYNSGVPFTAVYHVTVPADAAPGTYYFTNPDPEPQLIYYLGGSGPSIVNITGSNSVTVASYALSVVASPLGGGTATDQTNASPYIAGATVNLSAAANAGYRFNGWTATAGTFANAGAASTTFTMPDQAATVTANFVPTYVLSMAVSPGGTGTATDQTNASPYIAGATVNITAAANAGYHFVNWTSTAGTFANAGAASTTFTMPSQAATLTANFALSTYTLSVVASPLAGGTATDLTAGSPYIAGATVNITAAANTGYQFLNWTSTAGTFANAGAASTTFTMPSQAATVTANFVYRAVIQGLTMDVKGTILGGVTLTLDGTTQAISAGDGTYQLIATTLGSHTVIASKAGYRSQTRTVVVTDPTISYNLDFKGDNGLVPNTLEISYVLACINKWQYPPADDTDLSMLKVLSVINAWKYPIN